MASPSETAFAPSMVSLMASASTTIIVSLDTGHVGTPSIGKGLPALIVSLDTGHVGTPSIGKGLPALIVSLDTGHVGTPSIGKGLPALIVSLDTGHVGTPLIGAGLPAPVTGVNVTFTFCSLVIRISNTICLLFMVCVAFYFIRPAATLPGGHFNIPSNFSSKQPIHRVA
jgi:hypothetical protein